MIKFHFKIDLGNSMIDFLSFLEKIKMKKYVLVTGSCGLDRNGVLFVFS
jgi:hypothetical protein